MTYNVEIRIHSDKNAKQLAQMVAQLVESATGNRCTVSVVNRRPAIKTNTRELDARKQKLLKR